MISHLNINHKLRLSLISVHQHRFHYFHQIHVLRTSQTNWSFVASFTRISFSGKVSEVLCVVLTRVVDCHAFLKLRQDTPLTIDDAFSRLICLLDHLEPVTNRKLLIHMRLVSSFL